MANRLSDIDWFKWNGTKCTDYGIHVLQQPTFSRPIERVTFESIPGRSGSLTVLEGDNVFDDVSLSCICVIDSPYSVVEGATIDRILQIDSWLRGDGKIVFANRQDGFYRGRIANQISFGQILRGNPHLSFSVGFQCKPFFYHTSGETIINASANPMSIVNPGNIPSEPSITLYGSGEGGIMIGDRTMLVVDFSDLDYITIDCEAKLAYKGIVGDPTDPLTLLNGRITGEWLTIPTGSSYVTLTGGITSAEITPRWRSI